MIEIHSTARVSPLADIEDSIRGSSIVVGEASVVDSFVKIKPAGGTGDLRIGSRCYINSGVVMYTGNGISLGNDVLVGANCTFAPTNHAFRLKDVPIRQQGFLRSRGGIVVEDDVWIGAGTVLLDGSFLRRGCVVGAGSLVRTRLDPFTVYGGTPLRKISVRC